MPSRLPPPMPWDHDPTSLPVVLVVDDEHLVTELVARLLSGMCTVRCAHSGEAALAIARSEPPDLLLLDVRMPHMDGFTLFEKLQASSRTAHIPAIFLTASNEPQDEETGLNMGAVDFITKPFRPAVLQARVRNHLQLVQQRQRLERLSHIDGLTEIANRRAFNAALPREWLRMQRNQQPLALLMIDVDDFKAYNDHWGHVQGDACLQHIAQALSGCLRRAGDMLARYGGEEFVALLPETNVEGATKLAHDLRNAVAQLAMVHPRSTVGPCVSISVGVASSACAATSDCRQLLASADQRLYLAKMAGRNRVVADDAFTHALAPQPLRLA